MKWNFYTSNEIKPRGWMRRQLELQARGLSGNLDKIWPDVRDSSWIGGDAEGWERVPYWLDGFVPLAYLLEDEDMIARAKKYIDAILAAQCPDGWICPCTVEERATYDTWAVQLIAKVLTVYYECSRDERIPAVIERTLKNYYELLSRGEVKLFDWGKARWYETFIAINFLYERSPAQWLVELAKILREQGTDYNTLTDMWHRPLNKWQQETHIVNLCMMLKYEAVSHKLLGEDYLDRAEALMQELKRYNGTPVGLFTGDECLSGLSPIQGTELCSVVELMYSYEHLFAATGDPKWAERLETVAFNALPATISDDMWTHQYVQMSNQIACQKFPGKSVFRTNNNEAHLFGLEPHFGCCTANHNQGWPKLALSTFMHKGNAILSAIPLPATLNCDAATVEQQTNYPFENSMHYSVTAKRDITFTVRIPSFAKALTVDGKPAPTEDVTLTLAAGETRELDVAFETVPYLEARPHELVSAKCGSLVFSLPITFEQKMHEYEKKGVVRKFPYCDYELIPTSAWNYALADDTLVREQHAVADLPFSSTAPAVTLKAKGVRIDWGLADGYETVCAREPEHREPLTPPEDITLYPYGAAKLRMTEMPLVKA